MRRQIVVVFAALAGILLALVAPTAAQASTAAPSFGCRSGDTTWIQPSYNAVITRYGAEGGSEVTGEICIDHTNTGRYWAVKVNDVASDGKCAHAVVNWYNASGQVQDADYGMYVCGSGTNANFYTPTRNWTRYAGSEICPFVDGLPTTNCWYYSFS
jgi:hypothetical protein